MYVGLMDVVAVILTPPRLRHATQGQHVTVGEQRVVQKVGVLDKVGGGVDPEAIDASGEPVLEDRVDLGGHGGLAPVEIWLRRVEEVQIILARELVEGPCGATKMREPIVGWPAIGGGIAPDVIGAVRIVSAG